MITQVFLNITFLSVFFEYIGTQIVYYDSMKYQDFSEYINELFRNEMKWSHKVRVFMIKII